MQLLAGCQFVHEGELDDLGQGVGGDDAVQAGGDLPAEPFGDVTDGRLGAPAHCPPLAGLRALPQQGEEHPGEPVADLGDSRRQ